MVGVPVARGDDGKVGGIGSVVARPLQQDCSRLMDLVGGADARQCSAALATTADLTADLTAATG
ncbi:hypothetical protein [Terrabacter terrigena]|uniref:IclR-ED domain-containing protein n=1 Tax=Terrabacter terrigena TaxID=574718 RepID=A0ABW3MTS0_9MICO